MSPVLIDPSRFVAAAGGATPALVSSTKGNVTATSSSSWTFASPGLPTAAGQLFVLFLGHTQANPRPSNVLTLSKPAGETNSWTITNETDPAGTFIGAFAWIYTTTTWAGHTLSGTGNNSNTGAARAWIASIWSGCSGSVSGSIVQQGVTAQSSPLSAAIGAGPVAGDLLLGFCGEAKTAGDFSATTALSSPTGSTAIDESHTPSTKPAAIQASYVVFDGTNKTYGATSASAGLFVMAIAFDAA
jgi:hypothetical protein